MDPRARPFMRPSRALVPAVPYARAHERGDRDPARVTPPFGQSVGVRYGRGRIIRGQGARMIRRLVHEVLLLSCLAACFMGIVFAAATWLHASNHALF